MGSLGHAPSKGENSGLVADILIDNAEFQAVPVSPANCGLRLTMGRLYPESRRITPGSIPLGKMIYPLKARLLTDVAWSTFEGGNANNTPPSGVQVVGPIRLDETNSRPAARVFVYAANEAGHRPSSAGSI